MKMPFRSLALALIAVSFAAPALAQEAVEEKNVVSGKVKLDSQSGYMFISGPTRQVGMFLKIPEKEDFDAYAKDWEAALAKAQSKYVKQLARWESDKKMAEQTKSKPPEKPVEPTRENFSIGSIETRNSVAFGPDYVFSKDKVNERYTYLIKVKPGTYVYHGPIALDPNQGYMGQCYCMGSVQTAVTAGTITDLGNFLLAAPFEALKDATPDKKLRVASGLATTVVNQRIEGLSLTFGVPETLKALPNVQADFHASGKMDNHFGVMIGRMPPIRGVLGYQRDKVVDLKVPAEPAPSK